jgi:hypothetical protein
VVVAEAGATKNYNRESTAAIKITSVASSPTVNDAVSLLPSLATAAPSVLNGSPVVATRLPQPQTGLRATDSAVLWMVEQVDASKSAESSIGGLARQQQSALIPDAGISVFEEEDDWVARAVST